MRSQPRWFWASLLPIAAGLLWMAVGWRTGIGLGLLASLPGGLLLASGTALLLWPGDRQISHYMAFGALLSLLVSVAALVLAGIVAGTAFIVLGIASYLVAGYAALFQDAVVEGVPAPRTGLAMARKVALDEAVLAYFVASADVPTGAEVDQDMSELRRVNELLDERGWVDDPAAFHRTPEAPEHYRLEPVKAGGERFEHLSFLSAYQPRSGLPGGDRWMAPLSNRVAHAWVLRHEGGPRPWLMGIHGYRMGLPRMDFMLFDIDYLHRRLGLNLVLPILPLHGPRKAHWRSGTGFLDGMMVDILHAEAQAAWDLRRTLAWLRSVQAAPAVGALGYSLGGYNTALLAGLDPDLACAIAGIPLTDIPQALWRHMPTLHLRYMESHGVTPQVAQRAFTAVSPLALQPRIPLERRYLFAAVGDQLVPTDQPLRLWRHWQEPACCWYQGSHLSVRRERDVSRFIASALADSGLGGAADEAPAAAS